jgi:hypothetical protein
MLHKGILLAAVTVIASVSLSAPAVSTVKSVGAVSWTMLGQPHPTQEADATDYELASDSGADHGRLNVSWLAVDNTLAGEPDTAALEDPRDCTTPLYRWCQLDQSMYGYVVIEQRVNPILIASPEWANPSSCTAHEDAHACHPRGRYIGQWVDFVRAAIERYGPGGIFPEPNQMGTWEVWNEPNLAAFWDGEGHDDPRRDAGQYARLVAHTREAAPDVRIAGPSVSHLPGHWSWLRTFAHRRAARMLDTITGHLYAPTAGQVARDVTRYRRALPRRPLWLTELGFGSGPDHTGSEEAQADSFSRLLKKLDRRRYVKSLTWFAGSNHTAFGGTHNLYREDRSRKPIVDSFATAAAGVR